MPGNHELCTSSEIRCQMAVIAKRMFERRLLDTAGGNISVRCGDQILISPKYAGSKKHWQLDPEDFVEGAILGDAIMEDPHFSREGRAHLAIYRTFPIVNGVIHAHPFHVLPFAALRKPIPPVLEGTRKFGVVPVVPFAPAHSAELAEHVVAGLQSQERAMRAQAAAVILPEHGVIVAGKDLWAAVDAVERLDWNAWCIFAMKVLEP